MTYLPGGLRSIYGPHMRGGLNGLLLVSDTAYFAYLGYFVTPAIVNYLRVAYSVAGAAVQTAELGLFSSPLAPNGGNQTLTRIVATGVLDSLTAAGPGTCKNTNAFAQLIGSGVHLWGGMRTAMNAGAGAQPTMAAHGGDWGRGYVLQLAAAGALTAGGGGFNAVVPAIGATVSVAVAPFFDLSID